MGRRKKIDPEVEGQKLIEDGVILPLRTGEFAIQTKDGNLLGLYPTLEQVVAQALYFIKEGLV